ncbi:MAG: cyclase/dehydrase [Proteobacteria bacterium]|nr:cyclase/dehydrase [Pseudomonadota bacterium]
MREVKRSALVPYTAVQMFDLVADVERYPEFLPWCTAATVLGRDGEMVTAQLALSRGRASARFTTRNRLVPGQFLEMRLLEGPFRSLEGRWDFIAIGEAGSRVELALRFETQGSLAGLVLGPVFEGICNQLVDAFAQRARKTYG